MAVIQPYSERVTAQGSVQAQATADDFGAQIGRANEASARADGAVASAIGNVGSGIMDVAKASYENEVQDDVTGVHVAMAKKRAEWQQKLTDMSNNAKPGDQTIVPKVIDTIKGEFDDLSANVKTRAGQQTFAKMSADMTAMFGQEAVGIQSRLNGEFAKNQYTTLSKTLGSIAAKDYSQVKDLIQQGIAAIDDPNGMYARVPESTRQAFKDQVSIEIKRYAAKGFARQYPDAVLGTIPEEIRDQVREAVANPPTPGVPPDLKAPLVKAYTPEVIDSRAKLVAAPSPYDKKFQEAAQLYNLDWRELKMRAVVESGLNPSAVSSQNAGGLMQFTPEMAKQLGVDRENPEASIMAAAKLLADYRSKANGDMAKVDMMYYGGEGGTAWGPNTKQYAANLAALRGAVGLGTSVAPEQFAQSPTAKVGTAQDGVKAKTGIDFIDDLPAADFFSVLTEAEHYKRAYDSQNERLKVDAKHQQQVLAETTMDKFTQRIMNPTDQNGGRLSEVEIAGNPTLSSAQKQHMYGFMNTFAREQQSRMEPKNNPENVRELMLQIHAPDEDPTKIYNNQPIYDALSKGKISTSEFAYLNREVTALKDGSTNGFQKDVNNARGQVFRALQQNVQLQAMEMAAPGTIADIAYRFDRDMEKQIDGYRKQNKDPRTLLDPESRDYILKPGRISSFFPQNTVASAADKAARTQAATLPTYKDYDGLKPGQSYTDPSGNVRVKG